MPKAEVFFAESQISVTVPAGTRLIEVSERAGAHITYGCREGECGTCLVKVVEGHQHLADPSVLEDQVLRDCFAGRDQRLACQAQCLGGRIVVKA
jgi:ferredoxin